MENSLVGKYYIIPNPHEHGPHGKAQIIEHLHNQYYLVFNFDLCSDWPEFYGIVSLKEINTLPLFDNEEDLESFFSKMNSYHESGATEVEVSH